MKGAATPLRRLGLPFRHPSVLIATWFGAGLSPWAPGTCGSLAALPVAWILVRAGGTSTLLAAAIVAFAAGWWASDVVTRASGVKDPASIVIDEVVGQWLTLASAPVDPLAYAAGFALFRIFDIVKPWPVSWADRAVPGGLGIMLDDILAAAYAAGSLALGRYVLAR